MVRAAIIGLGRWGRSLVNAVHGKTDDIQFVAAHTRTRAQRRGLLPREGHSAARPLRGHSRRQDHRRRGAGDAAQPARRAGDGRRRPPASISMCEKPLTLDRPSARGRRRRGQESRHRAGGRLQPPLSSLGGRDPQAPRRRPARPGDVDGRPAHHLDRAVHRRRQLAGAARRGAGRRADRGRRAFHRPHDRVRRPGARRALHHRPLHPGARPTTPPSIMLRFESGATGLLFCSVATATTLSFTLFGSKGLAEFSRPNLGALPLRADLDRGADRPGHRAAGRDHREPGVRHAQRRAGRIRPLHRGTSGPIPSPIDQVLHGMAVFDAVVRSAKSGKIEKVE